MKVGINGMGRIGRLALRAAMGAAHRPADDPRKANRLEVVHLNELKGGAAATAHLLAFDSVQGPWRADIAAEGESAIRFNQQTLSFTAHGQAADIPWGDMGVELVLECTGKFLTPETLQGHFDRGAKRVIVAAPVKVGNILNIVVGVNHERYNPATDRIVTAASCTTNCLAPVVKVVHESFGIEHGSITTLHDVTNTQVVVDAFKSDLRRARSCSQSLIPTTTGSAKAIGMIFPELQGKLNGHAVRVPLLYASLTDAVFELKRSVTVEEVNRAFEAAAKGPLQGILGYETRPLVSVDYVNDSRSAIVDGLSTLVVNGTQLKVYAWYDNEWGYSSRLADLVSHVALLDDR